MHTPEKYKMKWNLLWNTTWKRKFWLWLVAFVSLGSIFLSLDNPVPLLNHLYQNEMSPLRLAPEKETGKLFKQDSSQLGSSHYIQINGSVTENPIHPGPDGIRLPPVDPGVFRNVRPSDKLDREIDNMTVVSLC